MTVHGITTLLMYEGIKMRPSQPVNVIGTSTKAFYWLKSEDIVGKMEVLSLFMKMMMKKGCDNSFVTSHNVE